MDTGGQECPNCKKIIAQQTWLIHQNVCARHNYLCDVCEQVISITLAKDHDLVCPDRFIQCNDCDELIRNADVKDHTSNECEMRIVNCKYCELGNSYCELDAHQQRCGSRTNECKKCHKRIQLKDYDKHTELCLGLCDIQNTIRNASNASNTRVKKSVRFNDNITAINNSRIVHPKNVDTNICPFCEQSCADEFAMQEHIFIQHSENL